MVWRIVTDLNTPALTSTEFRGAHWIDGADGPAVGARFVGRNEHSAIGAWESTAQVVAADENSEFAYVIGAADHPGSRWTYRIEPADVGVRLSQRVQIGPGPSGISRAIEKMPDKESRILQRRLGEHEANMRANLAKITELAESGRADG